jgi:hypothetical protein
VGSISLSSQHFREKLYLKLGISALQVLWGGVKSNLFGRVTMKPSRLNAFDIPTDTEWATTVLEIKSKRSGAGILPAMRDFRV